MTSNTRPLNWTVIATHVPPGGSLGGVVRYTTEFIRALARRDDVAVSVLTTRAAAETMLELVGEGGRVRPIFGAPVPLLSIAERHAPLPDLRRWPDVVHGVKHLVPSHTKALKVLTVHDMLLLDRPADFGLAKRILLPAAYRASIEDADLLLCVSDATRQRLKAHAAEAARRTAVVHLATSSSLRNAVAQPIATLAERPFALVVGDSSPRKNLRTVMTAWVSVRAQLPDAVLAVAGPPNWARTEIGATYDGLVSSGAVVPLGYVTDNELRWAYEHANVVLCPSLAEGFGLSAAEALDHGAPVIISADPAQIEICAGRAKAVLPPLDVAQWTNAMIDTLNRSSRTFPPRPRTWAQVVEDSVIAVKHTIDRRSGSKAGALTGAGGRR